MGKFIESKEEGGYGGLDLRNDGLVCSGQRTSVWDDQKKKNLEKPMQLGL